MVGPAVICAALLVVATRRIPTKSGTAEQAHPPPAASREPFARGRWRLAPPGELSRTVLMLSHILIRHKEVDRQAPFAPPGWNALDPAPSRNRKEARALAAHVAGLADQDPSAFGRLAESYSEDATTSQLEGSLGLVTANEFVFHPEILDAVAESSPGRVWIAETQHGFHVLKRRVPPRPGKISARRIVLGYAEAPWLKHQMAAGRKLPVRSRAEALSLALQVRSLLLREPGRMTEFVARYSDHEDAVLGGDIGVWSTREAGPYSREREVVSKLPIGGVSTPVDSHQGWQILVRIAPTPRTRYAAKVIRVFARPGESQQVQEADRRCRRLHEQVTRDPSTIESVQKQHCCTELVQWAHGRASDALSLAVEEVSVGHFTRPVRVVQGIAFALRVEPTDSESGDALFELPTPSAPDVFALASTASGPAVQALIARVATLAGQELAINPEQAERVAAEHRRLSKAYSASVMPAERQIALAHFQSELREILGSATYAEYTALTQREVTKHLMKR